MRARWRSALQATLAPGTAPTDVSLHAAAVRFVPVGTHATVENFGAEPIELLRFDLKTRPLPPLR